jgi:hypothetical protein
MAPREVKLAHCGNAQILNGKNLKATPKMVSQLLNVPLQK